MHAGNLGQCDKILAKIYKWIMDLECFPLTYFDHWRFLLKGWVTGIIGSHNGSP